MFPFFLALLGRDDDLVLTGLVAAPLRSDSRQRMYRYLDLLGGNRIPGHTMVMMGIRTVARVRGRAMGPRLQQMMLLDAALTFILDQRSSPRMGNI